MEKIICLILLLLTANLYSQRHEIMLPFQQEGKWGYMTKAKEVVVEPQFEEAFPGPDQKRYRIKSNGKYGYIDRAGQEVIQAKYEEATDFDGVKATVTLDGMSIDIGYDGEKNEKAYPRDCGTHRGITCFRHARGGGEGSSCENFTVDGKLHTIYKRGLTQTSDYRDCERDEEGNLKYKYIDTLKMFIDSIIPMAEGMLYIVKDSRISFLDHSEKLRSDNLSEILSKSQIEDVKLFKCETARCPNGTDEYIGVKENGLWGYDLFQRNSFRGFYGAPKVKKHIEAKYYSINSMAKGSALVEYEPGKFGYIDIEGKEYFNRTDGPD